MSEEQEAICSIIELAEELAELTLAPATKCLSVLECMDELYQELMERDELVLNDGGWTNLVVAARYVKHLAIINVRIQTGLPLSLADLTVLTHLFNTDPARDRKGGAIR